MDVAYSKLEDKHFVCADGTIECSPSSKTRIVRDGFKNYLWLPTSAEVPKLIKTDFHKMDEMMTHSALAAAAYTLKQAGYTSTATAWLDYLQNDFEAKWRKRNNKPSGFPFLMDDLFHPYIQFARYNYYMYKLTGQSAYYDEAKRIAGHARNHMIATSDGGYIWSHRFYEGKGSSTSGCQTTTYIRYTMQAMQDLAMMDSSLFSSAFMSKVATTVNKRVIGSGDGTPLRDNICGAGTEKNTNAFVNYPYAAVAPWDSSGNIEKKLKAYYSSSSNTGHYNLPAMMILSLSR